MIRTLVVGTSCVGKTTFAQRLARVLETPHIELDTFYWTPHWRPRDPQEFRGLAEMAIRQESWVIDSNHQAIQNMLQQRATAIIWLNYPFGLVLWRTLWRTLNNFIQQAELWAGNRESIQRTLLSRRSLLWLAVPRFRESRNRYRRLFAQSRPSHLTLIECRNIWQANAFLQAVSLTRAYRCDEIRSPHSSTRATRRSPGRFATMIYPPQTC